MMQNEAKTNGHERVKDGVVITDASMARIERRMAEIEAGGEKRVNALRDAVGEYIDDEFTPRDEEIASLHAENAALRKCVADLEHKVAQQAAVVQQVREIATRLEDRQLDIVQRIGRDGKGADPEAIARFIGERIEEPLQEFIRSQVETKLAALEERLKALPGRLPVVKIWHPESVTYEAELVSYDGSLYQARKDTAQTPGGSDWVCVARAGRDGCDGGTPNVCGEYDAHKTYAQLDVVAFDGSSFIANKDDPGICPGPDWQPLSKRGKPGRRGESITGPRGEKGEKGEPGPSIISWQLDRERYRASPLMSNGTVGPMLELRGLFEQFLNEVGSV
jgi:hypothetical protein